MQHPPFVSIIIPCRNEVNYIGKVIEDLLNQDYGMDKIEILVVDGESDDNTQAIILEKSKLHPNIKKLNNTRKIVPTGLNIGIQEAKGEIIVRIDAHCEYPTNYISYLVDSLIEHKADNVGVAIETCPSNSTLKAKAIAIATSSVFGVGDSMFRIGINKPKETDTVPFGCFKSSIFERIGSFDEELIRNQDDEFNARIIKNGGKIILLPDLKIKYLARDRFTKMIKMFYQYGLFKPLVNKKIGSAATVRQFIPPLFLLANIAILISLGINLSIGYFLIAIVWIPYCLVNSFFSFSLAKKNKLYTLVFILPITFILIHFAYGYGYLRGILKHSLGGKGNLTKDLSVNR